MIDHAKVSEWISFACNANEVSILSNHIQYNFKRRLTRVLGQAFPRNKVIDFSVPLWQRATENERKQVVIHEACHIIATHKYGASIKPHGHEWKQCMVTAGCVPLRCHNVDRQGLRRQYVKYAIQCLCTTVWVGHVRAKQVRSGWLSCKRCKHKLKLTGETHKPVGKW